VVRVIKYIKGHGMRFTAYFSSRVFGNWYVKVRWISETKILRNECRNTKILQKVLMSPDKCAFLCIPPFAFLLTSPLNGVSAHKLLPSIDPKIIIASLWEAIDSLHQIEATKGEKMLVPKWMVKKSVSMERIMTLDASRRKGKELHPDFDELSKEKLEKIVRDGKISDARTIVHGDLCMPNILIKQDGKLCGLVDFGATAVADPLIDVAILSWCIRDNMGEYWEEVFLSKYSINVTIKTFGFTGLPMICP